MKKEYISPVSQIYSISSVGLMATSLTGNSTGNVTLKNDPTDEGEFTLASRDGSDNSLWGQEW